MRTSLRWGLWRTAKRARPQWRGASTSGEPPLTGGRAPLKAWRHPGFEIARSLAWFQRRKTAAANPLATPSLRLVVAEHATSDTDDGCRDEPRPMRTQICLLYT